jgi:hypothetical protein
MTRSGDRWCVFFRACTRAFVRRIVTTAAPCARSCVRARCEVHAPTWPQIASKRSTSPRFGFGTSMRITYHEKARATCARGTLR